MIGMPDSLTISCIQVNAGADIDLNIITALEKSRAAIDEGACFIALPEYFSQLEIRDGRLRIDSFTEGDHPALNAFRNLAIEAGVWVLLGSIPISFGDGRMLNRSVLIDATGTIASRYDKIHLFDVDLSAGERYRESEVVAPGDRAVVAPTPWAVMGMSICYDLRFPHLYRRLARSGAMLILVPAAFTRTTGQAHWHVLLRARAIENGAFVVAPAQCGQHGEGETYGHSLIIDPWGRILAEGDEQPGIVTCVINPREAARARAKIPSLSHDRLFSGPEAVTK